MFRPQSIAVVGVSRDAASYSRRLLGFLLRFGYPGTVVGVNPNLTEVDGVPCVPTLADVGSPIDLALVFTPAARVVAVIEDAAASGTNAAVVFSSGFAETGEHGRALQNTIREIAAGSGLRVLGPNCQGVVHVPARTIATFSNAAGALDPARVAPVAYVGQSGAVGGAMFDLLRERGLTPSAWVSTGNQVDVSVTEVTAHLVGDPAIDTILVYLEDTPDGHAWSDVCEDARRAGKQLVALHAGATDAGRRAVASHTGALVGERRAFELTSAASGVVLVDDLEPMIDVALARFGAAHRSGRRLAVVTTSGGAGSLAADWCERCGLQMATLSPQTRATLDTLLPDFASSENPIDVTGMFLSAGADRMGELCRLVSHDPGVDHTLLVLTNTVGDVAIAVAESLAAVRERLASPLSVVYLSAGDRTTEPRRIITDARIPVFRGVAAALRAIGVVATTTESVELAQDTHVPESSDAIALTEARGRALLEEIGVAVPASLLVESADEAARAAYVIGGTVVLKLQVPGLLHKTDVGAVLLDVQPEDAARAFETLVSTSSAEAVSEVSVLVQEQVAPGIELLVGLQGTRDGYPALITVGMGGTAVEVYGDVVTSVAPVDPDRARELLRTLRGWPLLNGFRGRPPADLDAAVAAIAAISRLGDRFGDALVDLEVNPLIVHEHGVHAVDFVCHLHYGVPAPSENLTGG